MNIFGKLFSAKTILLTRTTNWNFINYWLLAEERGSKNKSESIWLNKQ